MAISFPVSLSSFFSGLPILNMTFHLREAVDEKDVGSEVISTDYGPSYWEGSFEIGTRPHADAEAILSMLRVLRQPGASCLIHPFHNLPTGGNTTATLDAKSNSKQMKLSGLAPSQVIRRGQFLSVTYGSNPLRYGLYQAAEEVLANGSGVTPYVQVVPTIEPGVVAGATIKVGTPVLKARILRVTPPAHRAVLTPNTKVEWRQTLR